MAKLDTAEAVLDYLVAHPERAALAAFDVGAPHNGIAHRAETPLPIGSVFKVAVLFAVARAVVEGRLDLEEQVPLADLAAYRLAGTGVDVHEMTQGFLASQGVSFDQGAIALREVVRGMMVTSDNECTDYLIMRLGQAALEAVPAQLGLPDWEPSVPISGLMALWSGPELGARPRDWTSRCLRMDRRQLRDEAYRRTAALRDDPTVRERVAIAVTREVTDIRGKRLAYTLPRATATAVATMMARVVSDTLEPAGVGALMQDFLGWPLEMAPVYRDTFTHLGYKPGVIEGLLAAGWYGRRGGDAPPRVVALILHDLPLADFRRLKETAAMQVLERRLLSEDDWFRHVHQALAATARRPESPRGLPRRP